MAIAPSDFRIRKPRQDRRVGWAVIVSLSLHAFLLLAFLIHASGGGWRAGGGLNGIDGGPAAGRGQAAIALTLVPSYIAAGAPTDPLKDLVDKAQEQAAPASQLKPPPKRSSLDAVMSEADKAARLTDGAKGGPRAANQAKADSPGVGSTSTKAGVSTVGGSPVGPAGDLFAQIEPCWRRALGASTVPVTLEVVLDRTGRVSGPPKVASEDPAASEGSRRLAVERALQAIAACLPYRAAQGSNPSGVYQVAFGVTLR